MSGIVHLDLVCLDLVEDEELPQVRLTLIVSSDTAFIFAAQVLAVERLEGEPYLFLSIDYLLHLPFLPGKWIAALEGSDLIVLGSLEPSVLTIEEGVPCGAEGSLETLARKSSRSCQFRLEQAGDHHKTILFFHCSPNADERVCLAEFNIRTEDTAI